MLFMSKNIKKYGGIILILYQFAAIIASIMNLIYDFTTGKTYVFFASYVSWFIPQYYMSVTGNRWNLLPLILFIGITLFLFIKSAKNLLPENEKFSKYPALNILWLGISQLSYMLFFCFHITGNEPPYFSFANLYSNIAFFFIYLIFIFVKYDYSKVFKNSFNITSYAQIRKYAVANSAIAIFGAIWNLWMHYFGDTSISNPKNHSILIADIVMLFIFVFINITLLCITIIFYYNTQKSNCQSMPCKYFLLKINLLQISAIILEVTIVFLDAFVIFNKL